MKWIRRHLHGEEAIAMSTSPPFIERRRVLRRLALGFGAPWSAEALAQAGPKASALVMKPIPSTGEALPVVGFGTWITFNVGNDRTARVKAFFDAGGRMIDSSPMYGSSQPVVGYAIGR